MIILKHGTLKFRKFVCGTCGCEFVADTSEYERAELYCQIDFYEACCPCCSRYTRYSEPWEEDYD